MFYTLGERDDIMCYTDVLTLPCNEGTHTARFAEGHIEDRDCLWCKKKLKVYFMNVDDMPNSWKDSDGDRITRKEILKVANEWHECNDSVVPKFVPCDKIHESDIRVEFIGKSILGHNFSECESFQNDYITACGNEYQQVLMHKFIEPSPP